MRLNVSVYVCLLSYFINCFDVGVVNFLTPCCEMYYFITKRNLPFLKFLGFFVTFTTSRYYLSDHGKYCSIHEWNSIRIARISCNSPEKKVLQDARIKMSTIVYLKCWWLIFSLFMDWTRFLSSFNLVNWSFFFVFIFYK